LGEGGSKSGNKLWFRKNVTKDYRGQRLPQVAFFASFLGETRKEGPRQGPNVSTTEIILLPQKHTNITVAI
jgi:hypothetical protein